MLVGRKPTHNFTLPNGNTTYRGELRPTGAPPIQNVFPADPNSLFVFPPFPAPVVFDSVPGSDRIGLRRNGLDRSFFFTSLILDYEVADGYTLSYNGGYSNEVAERLWDFELSPENNYFGNRRTNSESHSHELKLASPADARFTWLIGAAYFNQKLFERDAGGIFGWQAFPFLASFPGAVFVGAGPRTNVDRKIDNYAVFGSLGYQFTDQLSVSLEGRWQRDELTDTVSRATGQTISAATNAFLPRAILQYQASPDLLLYASAAKGLRPTTINSQFAGRTDAQKARLLAEFPELDIAILAPPETIWSYEVGLKSTLMGGRMTFNANAYYSDWSNSQDLRSLLADIDGNGVPVSTLVTLSGPDIEAYGLELDTAIRATDNVSLGGSLAWNHTKLTGDTQEANQARFLLQTRPNGERLAQVPEFSASAFAQYDGALSDKVGWFLRTEGVYVGSRYASSLNLTETGASFDLNVRLGFELETFTATFFVTNLLQDRTFESLRSNADCATTSACFERAFEAVLPNKRQFGVNLRAKF